METGPGSRPPQAAATIPNNDDEDQYALWGLCVFSFAPLKRRWRAWLDSASFANDIRKYIAILIFIAGGVIGALLPLELLTIGFTIIFSVSAAEIAMALWLYNWWKDHSATYTWAWWSALPWQTQLAWIAIFVLVTLALAVLNLYAFGFALGIVVITDFLGPLLIYAGSVIALSVVGWILEYFIASVRNSTPEVQASQKQEEETKKAVAQIIKEQPQGQLTKPVSLANGASISITFSPAPQPQESQSTAPNSKQANKENTDPNQQPTLLDLFVSTLSQSTLPPLPEVAQITPATPIAKATESAPAPPGSGTATNSATYSNTPPLPASTSETNASLLAGSMSAMFSGSPALSTSSTPQPLEPASITLRITRDNQGLRIITSDSEEAFDLKESDSRYSQKIADTLFILGFAIDPQEKTIALTNKDDAEKKRDELRKLNKNFIKNVVEKLSQNSKNLKKKYIADSQQIARPQKLVDDLITFLQTGTGFSELDNITTRRKKCLHLSRYNYRLLYEKAERNALRETIQKRKFEIESIHSSVQKYIDIASEKKAPSTPLITDGSDTTSRARTYPALFSPSRTRTARTPSTSIESVSRRSSESESRHHTGSGSRLTSPSTSLGPSFSEDE